MSFIHCEPSGVTVAIFSVVAAPAMSEMNTVSSTSANLFICFPFQK
jgi:hypothetical protein